MKRLTDDEREAIAREISRECQREIDADIIRRMDVFIRVRIEQMKSEGWIHVWDEVES